MLEYSKIMNIWEFKLIYVIFGASKEEKTLGEIYFQA